MKEKKKSDVSVLLDYAGSHKGLTFLGLTLSAVSMVLSMAPKRSGRRTASGKRALSEW